ncbi:hypothetical protein [Photobacterium indicum]|uniref:hypothetical protein n=1 Tax=Photobacterium indicum TaxID=81447 RepID=UPI003D10C958
MNPLAQLLAALQAQGQQQQMNNFGGFGQNNQQQQITQLLQQLQGGQQQQPNAGGDINQLLALLGGQQQQQQQQQPPAQPQLTPELIQQLTDLVKNSSGSQSQNLMDKEKAERQARDRLAEVIKVNQGMESFVTDNAHLLGDDFDLSDVTKAADKYAKNDEDRAQILMHAVSQAVFGNAENLNYLPEADRDAVKSGILKASDRSIDPIAAWKSVSTAAWGYNNRNNPDGTNNAGGGEKEDPVVVAYEARFDQGTRIGKSTEAAGE